MKKTLTRSIVSLCLACLTGGASAAFVDFIEAVNETDPVIVATNLVLSRATITTAESASVAGLHHPGISPSPMAPGRRAAALFEPGGLPGVEPLVSDYILLTVGDVRPDATFGLAQDILIEFFSEDLTLSALLTRIGAAGFSFGGGVLEDGSLQDVSALLGTLPEGLIVRMSSSPGEVPEPMSLLLAGLALTAAAATRRRVLARPA